MKRLLPLIFCACAGGAAAAEQPADFAFGARLEADGKQALYEVTLPAELYRGVARADLGDVRVFNAAGEVVPHAFRPRRTTSTEAGAPVAITLFPLKADAGTTVDGLSIQVHRGAGGASRVDVTSTGAPGGEKRVVGYLADLTQLERALREIEFDFEPQAEGFAGKLRIDAGDDLVSWRTLTTAPLVSIEVGGARLQQKRIELPAHKARYLRLSWVPEPGGQKPPALASAHGRLTDTVAEAPRERIRVEPGRSEKPGEYAFDSAGHFPVDRVRILLPEPNTVVQVELLVRAGADQPWRPVSRASAYRLRQGEGEITSPDISIGPTTARYWLLRVDQRGGGVGTPGPALDLGWVPHRLVFAARGSPPFQLAYGNREAKGNALAIAMLIPGYRDEHGARSRESADKPAVGVENVRVLEQRVLGGEARRAEAIDWKRWSLWAALVLGVAILGAMAWRLARQMSAGGASSSQDTERSS